MHVGRTACKGLHVFYSNLLIIAEPIESCKKSQLVVTSQCIFVAYL